MSDSRVDASPDNAPEAADLVWPPPEEDLDSVVVIDCRTDGPATDGTVALSSVLPGTPLRRTPAPTSPAAPAPEAADSHSVAAPTTSSWAFDAAPDPLDVPLAVYPDSPLDLSLLQEADSRPQYDHRPSDDLPPEHEPSPGEHELEPALPVGELSGAPDPPLVSRPGIALAWDADRDGASSRRSGRRWRAVAASVVIVGGLLAAVLAWQHGEAERAWQDVQRTADNLGRLARRMIGPDASRPTAVGTSRPAPSAAPDGTAPGDVQARASGPPLPDERASARPEPADALPITPPDVVTPATAPPSSAASLDDGAISRAEAALAAGDRANALRLAATQLHVPASRATREARELIDRILEDESNGTERSRRAAQTLTGGMPPPAFESARRHEAAAVTAWEAGQHEIAFREFTTARAEFADVRARAAAAVVANESSAPPVASPVATTGSSSGAPETTAPVDRVTRDATDAAAVSRPSAVPATPRRPDVVPREETANAGAAPAPRVAAAPEDSSAVAASPPPSSSRPDAAPTAALNDPAAEVRRLIVAYQAAFERLDADAAARVFPSVDVRALSRAFDDLRAQHLEFDRCEISLNEAGSAARASCVGRAAFVPKLGGNRPTTEARRWAFTLQKQTPGWRITSAEVTRQ